MKSEKFVPKVLRDKLFRFDSHIIYCVHIKEQKQVIRVKNIQKFEDTEIKEATILLDYKSGKLIFQGFLLEDNNDDKVLAINEDCSKIPILHILKKSKDRVTRVAKLKSLKQITNLSNTNTVEPERADTVKNERTSKAIESTSQTLQAGYTIKPTEKIKN